MIIWIILIILFVPFGLIVLIGAPFVPSKTKNIQKILDGVKIRKGSLLLDLGSGDGRVLAEFARRGYKVVGYELNPILALVSKLRLRKYPLTNVHSSDYWRADVSKADVIFVFSATPFMARLYDKLKNELKPGAMVISYGFSFEGIKIDRKVSVANIYQF